MMKRFVTQVALVAALATGVASAQQILINAAGATFPDPMYSKWFDEYHKKFPNLQFNYQSIVTHIDHGSLQAVRFSN